jgi:hypothetical protein
MNDVKRLNHVSLYSMSEKELILVKRYLEKHLNKNFTVTSSISFVSLSFCLLENRTKTFNCALI